MNSTLQLLIAVTVIAGLTTLGGLWIASQKPKWYSRKKITSLVALGTGMLLALSFSEFLPEALAPSNRFGPELVFLGILFIIAMETFVAPRLNFFEGTTCSHDHAHGHDHKDDPNQEHLHHLISHNAACSAVGCLMVCAFFDGIQMNAAFKIGSATGWLTSMGLLFHILPDGVLAAGIAIAGGMTHLLARRVSLITGGALLLGSLLTLAIEQLIAFNAFVLPISAGVLTYVGLIHLLPVGLSQKNGYFWLLLGAAVVYGAMLLLPH